MSESPIPQYGAQTGVAEDPGKTLGIVGLVLAFVFALAGLIVSLMARSKSKAAGFKNSFATAGIVISSIALVAGLLVGSIGGFALYKVAKQCQDLGPGVHQVGSATVTCG